MILGNLFVYPDKTALTPSCYTTIGHLLCYHVFYFYVEIPWACLLTLSVIYILSVHIDSPLWNSL